MCLLMSPYESVYLCVYMYNDIDVVLYHLTRASMHTRTCMQPLQRVREKERESERGRRRKETHKHMQTRS